MDYSLASLQDVPALTNLLSALFAQETEFTPDPQAQTRALAHIIAEPNLGEIMVARCENKAVAMVSLLYTYSTALGGKVCWLEDMVVAYEYRGQTIGTQLLNYAIKHARQSGCQRITLLTDQHNTQAQHFYARQGFVYSSMQPMRLLLTNDKITTAPTSV
ncbi:MAG: GNAT family N-acetyltransferase [Marinagarivorans sp.]